MAGLKIKEAELVDELTEDCLFPISDGSGEPRVANFMKVKILLGDAKSVENKVNSLQKEVNYLTRNGEDSGMSVREISEDVLSPIATNVETLIGTDRDKSVRTIATEVLAGASTGGGIDLDLYLSKSEAENIYEKKGVGYTKGEIDNKINEAVRINGEELSKKADKTTVESLSASVDVNKDILENIIVPQVAANTEAIKGKASQEAVDDISESVTTLGGSVEEISNMVNDKADKEQVQTLASQLTGAIESKYTKPVGGIPVKDLAAEVATEAEVINAISKATETIDTKIGNKVDKETYDAKVNELVSDIEDKISKTDTIPAESIVPLSVGKSGIVADNPIIANRIPYLKADAFAFLQPEDFTVEVAYDGIIWETLDNNNADMLGMFAQWNYGTGFSIDGSNTNWQVGSKIRIALSPKVARNAKLDFVALNIFANGRIFDILTEYYDSSSGKEGWYSVGDPITINSNGIAFVKYNQYFSFSGYGRGGARFTFTITHNTQYGSRIVGISGYGNQAAEKSPTSITAPYTLGTLWYWDYLKNVYFPNNIYEDGKSLSEKYAGKSDVGALASVVQDKANTSYVNDFFVRKDEHDNILGDLNKKFSELEQDIEGVEASIPNALPNPNALEISLNGRSVETYNGSSTYRLNFYAPTKVGAKGQVFKSIDGVVVDWGNVDWSEIKNKPDTINFAKDLTGVLEATPEEFTFRPSAGDKSIRDESAVIRRIKGNTIVSGNRMHSMKAVRIETIGFNQWDEEWENGSFDITTGENIVSTQIRCKNLIRVLPNTHYSLSIGNIYMGIWAMFYDENNNILTPVNINSSVAGKCLSVSPSDNRNIFVTPANAAWMKFYLTAEYGTSYNNDICINLSHSGVRNGEYHPYKRSIFDLPEVLNYFPEGMNSVGVVYDEINAENAIQRCGIRRYVEGDEKNPNVRTDGENTVYILPNPIVKPILEPLQLAYDVEDFGTEQAITNQSSSPFRADIVYQFNAEGRIRDNGRNIERLETKVNTLDRVANVINGRFDGGYVKAEGIIDAAENIYLLPSSRSTEKDKRLANEQYVINSLPREVAQVLERKVGTIPQNLSPNILYEFVGSVDNLTIVSFNGHDDNYEDVWRIRCGLSIGVTINILPTVFWENGIAPNIIEWGIYEFEFKKTPSVDNNRILGRWRMYKS